MSRNFLWLFPVLGLIASAHAAQGLDQCGDLHTHYGPFDYWVDKNKLGIVESYHFTPEVESLRAGKSGFVGGDIDYTLVAFPNHPRALMAMIRLGDKERTDRVRGARYPVVCYLDRAVRFRPDDATVRMIYGTYLAKRKKSAEALEQLTAAEQSAGDDANLHYNLGLVYFDLGQFDNALKHAHAAYRMGFSLPGLKAKLVKAGKWREPEPVAAEEAKPAVQEEPNKNDPVPEAVPPATVPAASQR
jgi:tetratricopeptide (TPR) repeat protein